ncbi:MAG: ATP-binding protein [Candidatus Omnitrophica bacterium]|nr:ATP-binding protein [Candidatus Omnitrophota bacterium]
MIKKALAIIPCIALAVCVWAADAPQGAVASTPVETCFESARIFESAGNDTKAAEGYIYILANYPDDKQAAVQAFQKLKALYLKALSSPARAGAPDPGAFFAAIKNMYGNYKTEGRYQTAITVINYLNKIHETPDYYNDLGNIYLYGLNDANKAIGCFKKALVLGVNDYKTYTDLGLAYELAGDLNKAAGSYNYAATISPADSWVMYGLERVKGIKLARQKQIIRDWYFIGPFSENHVDEEFEEAMVSDTDAGKMHMTQQGIERHWQRPYGYGDYGYVNLNSVFQPATFADGYALTHIYASEAREVLFKVGSDDGIVIWLNGRNVWDNQAKRPAIPDNDSIKASLNKGWNTVLVKITQGWGGWGFYFRVTAPDAQVIPDLVFDPVKNTDRAVLITARYAKERMVGNVKQILRNLGLFVLVAVLMALIAINIRTGLAIRRMRRDFIAGFTHDLRIPLASIMGSAELLIDGEIKDPAKRASYYRTIASEARRLNRYISMILDASRNKKRAVPYLFTTVDLVDIIKRSIGIYEEETPSTGLKIHFDTDVAKAPVNGNEEALMQVFINLFSNADKYSPRDKNITVTVRRIDNTVAVAVKDRGIGIGAREQKSVFTRFYRAETAVKNKISGIGLGLASAKSIVEAHKGALQLKSEPEKGSTFTVSLPLAGKKNEAGSQEVSDDRQKDRPKNTDRRG